MWDADRSSGCGGGNKEDALAADKCYGKKNRGRCITGSDGWTAVEMTWIIWKSTTPTATESDIATRQEWNRTASRKRRSKGLSRMRCKTHVRFLVVRFTIDARVTERGVTGTRKRDAHWVGLFHN